MAADDHDPGAPHLTHHLGDPAPEPVAVPVGASLAITLYGTAGYAWTPVTSSDDHILTVTSTAAEAPLTRATVRALRPGTADLRATAAFRGDRFGPPTRLWRQTVRVSAAGNGNGAAADTPKPPSA